MELFYRFERTIKARISELCDFLEIADRMKGTYQYEYSKTRIRETEALLKLNRFYLDILQKKAKPRPEVRVISCNARSTYNRLKKQHLNMIKGGWYE